MGKEKEKVIKQMKAILITSDHAGFKLKEALKIFLKSLGYGVEDKGAFEYKSDDDYPDFIAPVAEAVSKNSELKGIILGGSGQGEAIVANRFPNVRAAVYYGGGENIVRLSREHNNSNILSLGARFLDEESAKQAVKTWLETPFTKGRHQRRLDKIEKLTS